MMTFGFLAEFLKQTLSEKVYYELFSCSCSPALTVRKIV